MAPATAPHEGGAIEPGDGAARAQAAVPRDAGSEPDGGTGLFGQFAHLWAGGFQPRQHGTGLRATTVGHAACPWEAQFPFFMKQKETCDKSQRKHAVKTQTLTWTLEMERCTARVGE